MKSPLAWMPVQVIMSVACVIAMTRPILAVEQHVVVVLDDSGSMAEAMRTVPGTSKMQAAKSALITVLNMLPPDARVGVVALNQGAGPESWIVPLGPIDGERTRRTINAVQANGGTPLGYFMKVAADTLLAERKEHHYGTYRLLVVTDGEATDQGLVSQYLPEIMARGITVDVIGVDMKREHSLATNVHSYRRADNPGQLQEAVQEVFAESEDQDNHAGDSDFSIVAGLPEEVAAAALQALARPSSAAIGTHERETTEEVEPPAEAVGPNPSSGGQGTGLDPSTLNPVNPNAAQPAEKESDGASSVSWAKILFIGLIILLIMKWSKRS